MVNGVSLKNKRSFQNVSRGHCQKLLLNTGPLPFVSRKQIHINENFWRAS